MKRPYNYESAVSTSPEECATLPEVAETVPAGTPLPSPASMRFPLRRLGLALQSASSGKEISQGFFSLADQGVASITNFVTGVILARGCTKEEFGLYMLGFTVILLVTDLQTSLITTPYTVYGPRLRGRERSIYSGSTLIHEVVFSLATMLALGGIAFVASFGIGPAGLSRMIGALAAVVALIMLREFVRRVCFARLQLKAAFVFDTCVGSVQLTGLLVLAHLHVLSSNHAYWLIGAVCAAAVICWLWSDRQSYNVHLGTSLQDFKKNWTVGKWVFASGLLWTASTNLYPWLLAFFHGTASAGTFAACMGVVSASNPVLLGIQNLIGPRIAHEYAEHGPIALRRLVLKISGVIAIPLLVLTLVLIVWGDRFIGLLYGHQYTGNGVVIGVLACNLLVTAVAFAFSRALFTLERGDLDFVLNLAAIAIMATLGLWLVRTYGPLGAAIGLLTAIVLTSTVRAAAFLKLRTPELVRSGAN